MYAVAWRTQNAADASRPAPDAGRPPSVCQRHGNDPNWKWHEGFRGDRVARTGGCSRWVDMRMLQRDRSVEALTPPLPQFFTLPTTLLLPEAAFCSAR